MMIKVMLTSRCWEGVSLKVLKDQEVINFTYSVPNFNQCQGCHISRDGGREKMIPLGVEFGFVNRSILLGHGGSINQLEHWKQIGVLEGNLPAYRPMVPSYRDVSVDIQSRAKAYLDINCVIVTIREVQRILLVCFWSSSVGCLDRWVCANLLCRVMVVVRPMILPLGGLRSRYYISVWLPQVLEKGCLSWVVL